MRSLTWVRYCSGRRQAAGDKRQAASDSNVVSRIPTTVLLLVLFAASASAQGYAPKKPRRQFVTIATEWLNTQPLHFLEHPLEDLVGRAVATAQFQSYEYRTRDEAIQIDVQEFSRHGRGAGITVYPLGISVGPAFALRLSREDLPTIRIGFAGNSWASTAPEPSTAATNVGASLFIADHSPGWGLGSHAFVGGGLGRINSELSDGNRYFAEGGGGLSSGPLGVELAVKFAWNHLNEPIDHKFFTVPITIRATLTF